MQDTYSAAGITPSELFYYKYICIFNRTAHETPAGGENQERARDVKRESLFKEIAYETLVGEKQERENSKVLYQGFVTSFQ
ncbi:MAG: hypothetical protein FWD61_10075 [Phycisphaerales bacterium]|nr:hypothetical protein [Phycisphaerales bacterium]